MPLFLKKQGRETILTVLSLKDKQSVKTFKVIGEKAMVTQLVWSQDGKNLAYILADGEFQNNALWQPPLNKRSAQQIADLGDAEISELFGFALSPSGKHFAIVQGSWKHDAVLLKGLK